MRPELGESDAGIQHDTLGVYAGRQGLVEDRRQFFANLGDDIAIPRQPIHCLGRAAHMHQHDGAIRGSDEGPSAGVVGETGDVVDDSRASIRSRPHGTGVTGIDRNDAACHGQRLDHTQGASLFLGTVDGFGAGAGAFAADINDIGAVLGHAQTRGDGGVWRGELAGDR